MSLLDWVNTDELLPLVVLTILLVFIGQQIGSSDARAKLIARRCGTIAFFGYAGLAITTWGVYSVSDLLRIVFRAVLGAGLVYSIALVIIPVLLCICKTFDTQVQAARSRWNDALTNQKRLIAENLNRLAVAQQTLRQAKDRKRQERFEAEQQASLNEQDAYDEFVRQSQVDASRETLIQFYREHEECLRLALPQALFLTRLKNKFPKNLTPTQADIVVEELILGLLPLIEEGKARIQTEQQQVQKERTSELRKRKRIANLEQQVLQLESTSICDSDIGSSESKAVQQRIQKLRELMQIENEAAEDKTQLPCREPLP